MKVCMISDLYFPDNVGGTETNLKTISENLALNNDVAVICTRRHSKIPCFEEINGVKVYRIDTGNLYSAFDAPNKPLYLKPIWHLISLFSRQPYLQVKEILKKECPDIVHTHNLHSLSLFIFEAVQELNIPLIHELHDYGLFCPRTNLLHGSGDICVNSNIFCKRYQALKREMVDDKPCLVISPSQFVIEKHLEHGFFGNTKHQTLIHGIKIPDKPFKKDYATIDILYVGQLSKHKGVHILIEAFKKIQREDLRLHIPGRGKNEEEFKNLARGDSRIRFYGYVSDMELNQLYDLANVLVVPSLWFDNSPTVIYEAFAQGTPVIGSRIGGIPELVHDRENGFLYEPRNEKHLIKILTNLKFTSLVLLEKKILRKREEYSIATYIKNIESIYSNILSD